jgi:hypothetical protein
MSPANPFRIRGITDKRKRECGHGCGQGARRQLSAPDALCRTLRKQPAPQLTIECTHVFHIG